MPINPNIALGVTPPQIQLADPNSGMNALARAMQIRGMQDESQVNALKMQELQRGVIETNALNDAYRNALSPDGSVDRTRLFSTLAEKNMGSRIPVLQKQFLEADTAGATLKKTNADTQKTELEMALKKTQHVASVLSLAKDPESYATVRAVIKNQFGQDLPEQFDPAVVQAIQAQGQTLTERLQAEHQRLTLAETVRHNTTTETETGRHNTSTEGIQRGQLAVSQGQLGETRRHNGTMEGFRSSEVAQGRVPAGYRPSADGRGLEFIPGGPADPNAAKKAAPTEFQGKAAMFGTRAQEADRIISELEGKYSPSGINAKQAIGHTPLVGGGLEAAANLTLSDASQKAEQAQRDFVNAVLRLESGAAISQGEFDNARKQYFRQPGDSPAVIAQKAQNRKTAIQGLINNARPGAVEQTGGATGSFGASPDIDALLKKYGGK